MITTNVNGNPISQGFIDEIRSDSPTTIARLWYNDAEVPCDIVNITVQKGSCGSDPFMIGEVIGDLLQATVKDLNANLKGEVIECHIGALVNDAYEFISLGRFKVSEVKKTRYQSEITAYSGIVADSGDDFDNSGLNEPTIAGLAVRLQSDLNCTISFDNGIDTTLPITAQLTEITDYQALQILAICCGGYAINTIDGNIVVKKYDATPTLEVDTGMMVNLPEIAEAEYRVRQIGVLVSDATVDNEGNEVEAVYYALDTQGYIKVVKQGTEYYLIDSQGNRIIADIRPETADIYFECAYMTEAMFEANIEPVVGYAYYSATIDLTLGDPRLEGSDVLQVEEVDGSLYSVPCHKIVHKYDGGFTTEVVSAEASDESNSIGTEYPITQRLQNLDRKTGTAQATADNAYRIADTTNQYFWFWETIPTGADPLVGTGAHISEVSEQNFNDPTSPYYHTGGNLLARSNGIAVRDGLDELATFGADGATIGKTDGTHLELDADSIEGYNNKGAKVLDIGLSSTQVDIEISIPLDYEYQVPAGGTVTKTISEINTYLTNGDTFKLRMKIDGVSAVYSFVKGTPSSYLSAISYDGNNAISISSITASNTVIDRLFYVSSEYAPTWSLGQRKDATAIGAFSYVEGLNNEASGDYSHAEGRQAVASGDYSHSEGYNTKAVEDYSHAEGYGSEASGNYSHAEGSTTKAVGAGSHAEGYNTEASGGFAHAEGGTTEASGGYSHAQNRGTIAQGDSQTALGKYNVVDNDDTYAEIVGNGDSTLSRKNISALDWDGNLKLKGDVYVGCNDDSTGGSKVSTTALPYYDIKSKITAESGVTINSAYLYVFGERVAQLYVDATFSSNQTADTSYDIGELDSDILPRNLAILGSTYGAGQITSTGVMSFRPQVNLNANSHRYFTSTYLLLNAYTG